MADAEAAAKKAQDGKDTSGVSDLYWVPDDVDVWLPCALKSSQGDKAIFAADDSRRLELPAKKLDELRRVKPEQLAGVDDICCLPEVGEGVVLHTVRERFKKDQIYTRVQKILIAVNPFCALPIYDSSHLDMYSKSDDSTELPPHIFGVSQDALCKLHVQSSRKDQVILISGESGAGKTESSKLILSFIADATRGGEGDIEEKILRCSPIFESFGNAMTVRNNNSSRFGKWLDMRFNIGAKLQIRDCNVTNYLLETTRVCGHGKGERSYHVFYQLLQARDRFPDLGLGDRSCYSYLQGGEERARGIDDEGNFDDTLDSFDSLGFEADVQSDIFRIVAAILSLGNIDFVRDKEDFESKGCHVVDESPAKHAAALLGVPVETILNCVLHKTLVIDGNPITKFYDEDGARSVRDTVSKLLYGRLFDWLVQRMNSALASESTTEPIRAGQSLGVLDIAGFESFETNSLEQLMINLSNEHLQQSFNTTIIKGELDDYTKEGVHFPQLNFRDNTDVLELLDGAKGILTMLDEECALPKATDLTYTSKVQRDFGKHARYVKPKFGGKPEFGIKHFAGDVLYTCNGFLEKNAQKLPDGMCNLLKTSEVPLLNVFAEGFAEEQSADQKKGKAGGKKPKSTTLGFRTSLRSLMDKIKQSERHYIRCIKANKEKLPGRFTSKLVFEQLLFSGVMEAVSIRQQGYSLRLPFDDFVARYRCVLIGYSKNVKEVDIKSFVDAVRKPGPLDKPLKEADLVMGKTKVFAREETLHAMEAGRMKALVRFSVRLGANCRRCLSKNRVRRLAALNRKLGAWLQSIGGIVKDGVAQPFPSSMSITESEERRAAALDALEEIRMLFIDADTLGLDNKTVAVAREAHRRVEQELSCSGMLEQLASSRDPVAIEKCLARAQSLGFSADLTTPLSRRARQLKVQLPLIESMKAALAKTKSLTAAVAAAKGQNEEKEASKPSGEENGASAEDKGEQKEAEPKETKEQAVEEPEEEDPEVFATLDRIADTAQEEGIGRRGSRPWLDDLGGEELFEKVVQWRTAMDEARMERQRRLEQIAKEKAEAEAAARAKAEAEQAAEAERIRKAAEEEAARAAAELKATRDMFEAQAKAAEEKKRKEQKAARRPTVTGLSLEHQQEALDKLQTAAETFDAPAIEELLTEAAKQGMKDSDIMPSKLVFEQLQNESWVISTLKTAEEDALQPEPSELVLKRLKNLSEQLARLKGDPDVARAAQNTAACVARRMGRKTGHDNSAFWKLADYANLKDPKSWKGHRSKNTEAARQASKSMVRTMTTKMTLDDDEDEMVKTMLSHCSRIIVEGLTRLPKPAEADAVHCFGDILKWMREKPAETIERASARDEILRFVRERIELRDEVYVQLMKQLTNNPCQRSVDLGWKLLYLICLCVTPSECLNVYVRDFLNNALAQDQAPSEDSDKPAKLCLDALHSWDSVPTLSAYLLKKSPAKLRLTSTDKRYFVIRNLQMFWYASKKDAEAPDSGGLDGGAMCKGMVNLLGNACQVDAVAGSNSMFTLRATDGIWTDAGNKNDVGTTRIFTFDAAGSDSDRQEWMDAIAAQIERARLVREQIDSHERAPSLHHLVVDKEAEVQVMWIFADRMLQKQLANTFPSWCTTGTLEDTRNALSEYLFTPDAQRPVTIHVTRKKEANEAQEPVSSASSSISVLSVFEAVAVIKELIAVRKSGFVQALAGRNTRVASTASSVGKRASVQKPDAATDTVEAARRTAEVVPDLSEADSATQCEDHIADVPPAWQRPANSAWKENEVCYYIRHTTTLPDGTELVYGARGRIAAVEQDGGTTESLKVRFHGITYTLGLTAAELSKDPPPFFVAQNWQVGDAAWYLAATGAAEGGSRIPYGTRGVVIGPGSPDTQTLAVRFPDASKPHMCMLSELSQEQPKMVFAAELHLHDEVTYNGPDTQLDNGVSLTSGAAGRVIGPDVKEADHKVVVEFASLEQCISCVASELAKQSGEAAGSD